MMFARTPEPSTPDAGDSAHGPRAVQAVPERFLRQDGAGSGLLAILLHAAPLGAMVIDASLRVILANPAGRQILGQDDGIGLADGRLRDRSDGRLERRLLRLLHAETGPPGECEAPFYLSRPSGRRPYEVTLRAPSLADGSAGAARRACLFVRDPDAGVPLAEASLRERFGLTPSEARTALALALGGTLVQHSELLRLRPLTLRGYLKQIFAKTNAHSQLDVVRLVLTGAKAMVTGPRASSRPVSAPPGFLGDPDASEPTTARTGRALPR